MEIGFSCVSLSPKKNYNLKMSTISSTGISSVKNCFIVIITFNKYIAYPSTDYSVNAFIVIKTSHI